MKISIYISELMKNFYLYYQTYEKTSEKYTNTFEFKSLVMLLNKKKNKKKIVD